MTSLESLRDAVFAVSMRCLCVRSNLDEAARSHDRWLPGTSRDVLKRRAAEAVADLDAMAEKLDAIQGMIRMMAEAGGVYAGDEGDDDPVDRRHIYRGTVLGGEAPVRLVRPGGDDAAEAGPAKAATPGWRDRLVFDLKVSGTSPVVRGTWVTVAHIVGLIAGGHSWGDVLRSHPELTEEGVRAALAYAVAGDREKI